MQTETPDRRENGAPGFLETAVDGVTVRLKRPFDFGFLRAYGRVFRVFDDQDSGNVCFGAEKDGKRFFVKFAGAPAARYDGDPQDAVARLKAAVPVYRDLRHRCLVPLLEAEEIGRGFAAVFEWVDGEGIGIMYPGAHRRFMALPVGDRLGVFRDILDFFAYVAAQNYVAVDFYDGSLLYDFARKKTAMCDVDFFRKQPCVNDMGRMWGSARFLSPEEYRLGAVLDEVTNVYTLGAAAFALFGDGSRARADWQLGGGLFAVAERAVRDERAERQPSIAQFIEEWEAGL